MKLVFKYNLYSFNKFHIFNIDLWNLSLNAIYIRLVRGYIFFIYNQNNSKYIVIERDKFENKVIPRDKK